MMTTRHYKGEYFAIQTLNAQMNGEDVVIYQSLQNDSVYVVPLRDFLAEVKDADNPTGQKYVFERTANLGGLSTASTEALIGELKKRPNNPFSEVVSDVFQVLYLTGRETMTYLHSDLTVNDFEIDLIHESYEEALERLTKANDPNMSIIKQLWVKLPTV